MAKVLAETHKHPKYPRLSLDLRKSSRFYQGRTFLDGKVVLKSLKTTSLPTAFKLGEDWYKKLLRASVEVGKRHPLDKLAVDPTVAEVFASYKATLTKSKQAYADMKWSTIQDFWRTLTVNEINTATFRDFIKWRKRHKTRQGTGIKNHSVHKDVMVIRQILKFAIEEEMLEQLPIIPKVGKIEANPRPWLTAGEWKHLLKVSDKRIKEVAGNDRLLEQRRDLHDQMVFMVASMVRVGEMLNLKFKDCRVEEIGQGDEQVLIANVNGKRGPRTIVATAEAVEVVGRREEAELKPMKEIMSAKEAAAEVADSVIFEEHHREAFKELLKAAKLYEDAQGFTRNFKSLRATAISFRVMQKNANLLLIARNAGTSLAMIDQFYARRLSAEMGKEELGTALIDAMASRTSEVSLDTSQRRAVSGKGTVSIVRGRFLKGEESLSQLGCPSAQSA